MGVILIWTLGTWVCVSVLTLYNLSAPSDVPLMCLTSYNQDNRNSSKEKVLGQVNAGKTREFVVIFSSTSISCLLQTLIFHIRY